MKIYKIYKKNKKFLGKIKHLLYAINMIKSGLQAIISIKILINF